MPKRDITAEISGDTVPSSRAFPEPPRSDAFLGARLDGRYLLEKVLGEGGMGYVYLARHELIGKRVAVKILRQDMADDKEMAERFINEARAASSIDNPHIVDISDFGRVPHGAPYFVMELLDGENLSEVFERTRPFPFDRLLHIGKQTARGLAAAHAGDIVHRDLKPENVMLITQGDDRDFVKILDFGIAKIARESARLTRAGSVFGTPHYMSPEQASGVPVDPRTDIYSLGVMLYELAAGRVPFDADNFMAILTQHMYKLPKPIRELAETPRALPPGLEEVIRKMLAKEPSERYASMADVIAELERIEQGVAPIALGEFQARTGSVASDVIVNQVRGPARRARGLFLGVVAGAVLLVMVVVSLMVSSAVQSRASTLGVAASADPIAAPPSTAPAVPGKPVVVTTEPVDATITIDDGHDLPVQQPRTLVLAPGETMMIRIESAGYKTRRMLLDLAQIDPSLRVVVRLDALATKPGQPSAAAVAAPAPPPKSRGPAAPPPPKATTASKPVPSAPPPPATTTTPPPPAPESTMRPSWCPIDDWEPFLFRCKRPKP